jgi:hypothetical protein
MLRAYESIPVLRQVFPDTLSYNSALGAYNWFLSILDFINQKAEVFKVPAEKMMANEPLYTPDVPPNFFRLGARDLGEAHAILFLNDEALVELDKYGARSVGEVLALWKRWLRGLLNLWAAERFGMREVPGFLFEPPPFRPGQ